MSAICMHVHKIGIDSDHSYCLTLMAKEVQYQRRRELYYSLIRQKRTTAKSTLSGWM